MGGGGATLSGTGLSGSDKVDRVCFFFNFKLERKCHACIYVEHLEASVARGYVTHLLIKPGVASSFQGFSSLSDDITILVGR